MPAESSSAAVDDPHAASGRLAMQLAALAASLDALRGIEPKLAHLGRELRRLGTDVTIVRFDHPSVEEPRPAPSERPWDLLYELGEERCALLSAESIRHLVPGGDLGADGPVLVARLGDRVAPALLAVRGESVGPESLAWWAALFDHASRSLDTGGTAATSLEGSDLVALADLEARVARSGSPADILQAATDMVAEHDPRVGAAVMVSERGRRRLRATSWCSRATADERNEVAVLLNRAVVRACLEQALDPPRTVAITGLGHQEGLPASAHNVPPGVITALLAAPVVNAEGRVACSLLLWPRDPDRVLGDCDRALAVEAASIVGRAIGPATFQAAPKAGPPIRARRDRALAWTDQLNAVFDAVLFGLVLISLDGKVLKINPAGRRVLDIPGSSGAGLRHFDDLDPRLLNGTLVPREIFPLAGPVPGVFSGNLDFSIRTRSGARRELGLTGVPVHGLDGHLQSMLYVFRDVSERRHLERQKNEFLSIASHELKTPLTSLKGYAQSLARRLDRNPDSVTQDEVKEKLRRMNRQVDRLALLIEDMLDVSRAQSGKLSLRLEHVDLRDIVNEVVERTFPSPADDPRGHPIHLSLPDAPVVGHWDRTRIDQVLTNLLTNAAKYSPPGEPIGVVLRQRDGLALLDVRDRGIGIPTDEQEHLFQPFFRARNASSNDYSGIGLGLYLSRELVLRHGGDITVTSAEGKGSVVHVELPCSTSPGA